MKLTSCTNYPMRSLQLAAPMAPELIRVDDVAHVHGLARAHATQIAHDLGRAGYPETRHGRGVGLQQAKPAADIMFGNVKHVTEERLDLVECFNARQNVWSLTGICNRSRASETAADAFMAILDDLTLADTAAHKGSSLHGSCP